MTVILFIGESYLYAHTTQNSKEITDLYNKAFC